MIPGCAFHRYQLEHLADGFDIEVDVYPRKFEDKSYHDMAGCVAQHNYALESVSFIFLK